MFAAMGFTTVRKFSSSFSHTSFTIFCIAASCSVWSFSATLFADSTTSLCGTPAPSEPPDEYARDDVVPGGCFKELPLVPLPPLSPPAEARPSEDEARIDSEAGRVIVSVLPFTVAPIVVVSLLILRPRMPGWCRWLESLYCCWMRRFIRCIVGSTARHSSQASSCTHSRNSTRSTKPRWSKKATNSAGTWVDRKTFFCLTICAADSSVWAEAFSSPCVSRRYSFLTVPRSRASTMWNKR
mmetsp:Transcript_7022/g.17049  ORF Transcript_7022/g.17049 Transcript_7022/m.17049 type:complete len:240 (+) Transcript_7022:842-1561(+)